MRFQVYLTIAFLAIVLCVVVVGFWNGKVSNLYPLFTGYNPTSIGAGIIGVFATVPFWLVGFDTILL
jgi:hypothetical protein